MKYEFRNDVRNDEKLRASFNELTRKTFYFDFVSWYENGHWQDKYIPHVLVDNGKVVSNVSVNLMQLKVGEKMKSFIQLGTVMTDPDYRNQGLNRYIMEQILERYKGKADGIYLFGNDSVLDYYPKFGFKSALEYEYSRKVKGNAYGEAEGCESKEKMHGMGKCVPYEIEKVDLSEQDASAGFTAREKLYAAIYDCDGANPNDGFSMCDNLGLYQFWLAADFGESVYYVPEVGCYVLADVDGEVLHIHQIVGKQELDVDRFVAAFVTVFGEPVIEVKLHFTPMRKDDYEISIHKEEDCTLFILGEDLQIVEREKLMFPEISHA